MQYLYIFWGKVIEGKKRGKTLGFPTANVRLHKKIPEGIYLSVSQLSTFNSQLPSVTFIGAAETFGEKDYKGEIYILDFDKNIYGQWITVKLIKKIRENKKFGSEKKLIEQMKEDVLETKKFFKRTNV